MRFVAVALLILLAGCTRTLLDYESTYYVVRPGDTLYGIAWRHGIDPVRLASINRLSNPDLISVGQRLALRTSVTSPARPVARAVAMPAEPAPRWQWPTRGPIVSAYGGAGALDGGIGIGGAQGQIISAAAAGRVVYAGSGLIGYGQLVIIKHNETYLSAYGHNRRLFVVQGDEVSQGQRIAEMGLGPDRSARLHFEIRRNGVPMDPMPALRSAG
jgi:lipoprotein NlpD